MIFDHWKDACGSNRRGLGAEWVRATWICRRWREVALDTPALWSSVLLCSDTINKSALETQLNRARGTALDLFVSDPKGSSEELEDVLELVLAKKSPIRKFKVVCFEFRPALEEFITAVAANIASLSLEGDTWRLANGSKWQFGSDAFPLLHSLALSGIIPTPGPPLLNLAQLELTDALDSTAPPAIDVHQFLAACPNLEVLRTQHSFEYDLDYMIDQPGSDVLPVVTLPKLRSLSVDELALAIATAVGTLRLPALTAFHLVGHTDFALDHIDFFIIPQNLTETLPPLRRSRSLSLVAGRATTGKNGVTLRGSAGISDSDMFDYSTSSAAEDDDGDDDSWSIVLPDLDDIEPSDPDQSAYYPLGPSPYCIGSVTGLFLARIPHLVVPFNLVHLQLHISNGLLIEREWAPFFLAMPHLRTLGIGSGALIRLVLAAFAGDVGLCPELEDLELCVGVGLDGLTDTTGENSTLAEFILRALGTWVRGRTTPLESLTIQPKYPDNSDSDQSDSEDFDSDDSDTESSSSSSSGSEFEPTDEELDDEDDDDDVSERNSERTESWAGKLYEDVWLTLKDFIHEVFLAGTDCPACGAEYEPIDWDAIARGELDDGVAYY